MKSLKVVRKELSNEKEAKKSYKKICISFVCSPVFHCNYHFPCVWSKRILYVSRSCKSISHFSNDIINPNRENFVEYDELPTIYIDAVISAEDKRFETHCGVDLIAISRAVVNDIKAMSFVEGGSTITQQIAKNQYFTQEKSSKGNLQKYLRLLS